jgi:hypothetical protein
MEAGSFNKCGQLRSTGLDIDLFLLVGHGTEGEERRGSVAGSRSWRAAQFPWRKLAEDSGRPLPTCVYHLWPKRNPVDSGGPTGYALYAMAYPAAKLAACY